jgi:hypothetical protein
LPSVQDFFISNSSDARKNINNLCFFIVFSQRLHHYTFIIYACWKIGFAHSFIFPIAQISNYKSTSLNNFASSSISSQASPLNQFSYFEIGLTF